MQAVERCVKLVTESCSSVCGVKTRDGDIHVKLELASNNAKRWVKMWLSPGLMFDISLDQLGIILFDHNHFSGVKIRQDTSGRESRYDCAYLIICTIFELKYLLMHLSHRVFLYIYGSQSLQGIQRYITQGVLTKNDCAIIFFKC